MWSKVHKVAGIKNLLKRNYHIPLYSVDVESEVDSKLSFAENWTIIKMKYVKRQMRHEDYE